MSILPYLKEMMRVYLPISIADRGINASRGFCNEILFDCVFGCGVS
jgi:hypothetical protein